MTFNYLSIFTILGFDTFPPRGPTSIYVPLGLLSSYRIEMNFQLDKKWKRRCNGEFF